jgi:phosphoglycerate dehydrogenase-like enzyme
MTTRSDLAHLAAPKSDALGRSKHVLDEDLIAAVDPGQLSYAALDAPWPEPLPGRAPLWLHSKVTMMRHVGASAERHRPITEIVANIQSLRVFLGSRSMPAQNSLLLA